MYSIYFLPLYFCRHVWATRKSTALELEATFWVFCKLPCEYIPEQIRACFAWKGKKWGHSCRVGEQKWTEDIRGTDTKENSTNYKETLHSIFSICFLIILGRCAALWRLVCGIIQYLSWLVLSVVITLVPSSIKVCVLYCKICPFIWTNEYTLLTGQREWLPIFNGQCW